MKTYIFVISALIAVQNIHSATIEEAKSVLNELREITEHYLTEASFNHSHMSYEIDSASLWAKEHGASEIQKKSDKFLAKLKAEKIKTSKCRGSRENAVRHLEKSNTEELLRCIESQASESVNGIFRMKTALGNYVSQAVQEEEKNVITCGQLDEVCLDKVVADIKDKISSVAYVIEDELNVSWYSTEVQLDLIKDCAYHSISNAQMSLETVTNCLY